MNKQIVINYFVDLGLAITFFLSFITGIIKFPQLYNYTRVAYNIMPRYLVSVIHDWSGIIMGLLVLVHLILHWRWIISMTKCIFGGNKKCDT